MSFIKNIKDTEPIEVPGEKIWEIIREPANKFAVGYAEIDRSLLHFHNYTHEWYFIVGGEGEVRLDRKVISVFQGQCVYIKPGTKHKAEKYGFESLSLYVLTFPAWSHEDHHLVEKPLF